MEIIGTNVDEEERKNKKTMMIIAIIIVILLFISIGLGVYIYYLKSIEFKFSVNGKIIKKYSSDLFIFEEDNIYISLKDIAPIIGYEYKNGEYKQYTEDTDSCYMECKDEVATLEKDSKKIYKTITNQLDYTYFYLEETVKSKNNKLYINYKDLGIICNVAISYNTEKNKVNINTLPYIVNTYISRYSNASLSNFNNQKALLYGLMVVQNITGNQKKDVIYGVNNLSNETIVGLKYKNIEFVEGSQEFIVQTPENKVGIVTKDGRSRVEPIFDELRQIDKDRNLYVSIKESKYGIVERNGKNLIYPEFEQIGLDITKFQSNKIKNRFILFDNAIPVKRNGKWGLYDVDGQIILPIEYDTMGCILKTNNDKNVNNILVIPEIEGIVVGKEYSTIKNNRNVNILYYGVVSSTGQILIPTWMESIYSVINSGQETYTMVNMGESYDLIGYIKESGILEREDNPEAVETEENEEENEENLVNEVVEQDEEI